MVKTIFILVVLVIASLTGYPQEETTPVETRWTENWKLKIGLTCYRTNMLLYNNYLFIGSNGSDWDEPLDSLDGIYVIDPKTGTVVKHLQHKAIGDNDVNGLAISTNGTLFFGGDMQYVYAYNAKTYEELWKYKTGADIESTPGLADLNGDGIEDVILVTQGNGVIALDGSKGSLLWHSNIYTHGGNVSPAIYDLNDDGVKDVIAAGGASFALNGKDGSVLWEHDQSSGMHASPLVIVSGENVAVHTTASYGSFDIFDKQGEKINGVGLTYGMFSSPVPNGQGYAAEGISWNNSSGVLTFSCNPSTWKEESDNGYYGKRMDIQSNRISGKKVSASAIAADLNNDGSVEFLIPGELGELIITDPSKDLTERLQLPAGAEATLFITDYDDNGSYTVFFAGLDGYLRSYEVGKVKTIVWPGLRGPDNNGVIILKQ